MDSPYDIAPRALGAGPGVQAARAARAPGWEFVWQEQEVTIYAKAGPEEFDRLRRCTRW